MKTLALLAFALIPAGSVFAASESCSVSLAQEPVVMRLGKDEFRIAFGLNGAQCLQSGCNGTIDYRAEWKTEDGAKRIESKQLTYAIPDGTQRSIVVDRHYFDTSEGKHTTDLTQVSVEAVSCEPARATASR